ncbi:MAG: DUF502 domain-containing protein [Candidatus Latescibacteria bacterium]|nr:DUF502 domain-containing protein [Candidatus Latescibacterota bacterium]NIO56262.1 DUF502 domain-containing protein [Candidatus Latescibacterota bacterium]
MEWVLLIISLGVMTLGAEGLVRGSSLLALRMDVVMIEYPRKGVYSYGFVTSYATRHYADGAIQLANVFIPGPPVPTTGVLIALPVEELFYLDISVEDALKLILSGGVAAPDDLRQRTPQELPGNDNPNAGRG